MQLLIYCLLLRTLKPPVVWLTSTAPEPIGSDGQVLDREKGFHIKLRGAPKMRSEKRCWNKSRRLT
jgi:hypothetical protein